MKYLRKLQIYVERHVDFLIIDMLTFVVSYIASVKFRKLMHMKIYHEELFLKFAIVGFIVYVLVEILNKNLSGVLTRSVPEEVVAIGMQMLITWSIYTVILFLMKEAHEFSRAIYVTAFGFCCIGLLIMRTLWKAIVRYTGTGKKLLSGLLVVGEGERIREIMERILPGCLENMYEVRGVVTNGEGDYRDWYPCEKSLDRMKVFFGDGRVQEAYVELDNAEEESRVIGELLENDIIVHRSLKDSTFDYASQKISSIGGKSVITIGDVHVSRLSIAKKVWENLIWNKDDE